MFKKINDTLNKSLNEETTLINSLPLGKYFLIYIPILFVIFSVLMFIASLFFEFPFDIMHAIFQAVGLAVFLRIFHKLRLKIQQNWNNKHN
jgi:hypothetical protein